MNSSQSPPAIILFSSSLLTLVLGQIIVGQPKAIRVARPAGWLEARRRGGGGRGTVFRAHPFMLSSFVGVADPLVTVGARRRCETQDRCRAKRTGKLDYRTTSPAPVGSVSFATNSPRGRPLAGKCGAGGTEYGVYFRRSAAEARADDDAVAAAAGCSSHLLFGSL